MIKQMLGYLNINVADGKLISGINKCMFFKFDSNDEARAFDDILIIDADEKYMINNASRLRVIEKDNNNINKCSVTWYQIDYNNNIMKTESFYKYDDFIHKEDSGESIISESGMKIFSEEFAFESNQEEPSYTQIICKNADINNDNKNEILSYLVGLNYNGLNSFNVHFRIIDNNENIIDFDDGISLNPSLDRPAIVLINICKGIENQWSDFVVETIYLDTMEVIQNSYKYNSELNIYLFSSCDI